MEIDIKKVTKFLEDTIEETKADIQGLFNADSELVKKYEEIKQKASEVPIKEFVQKKYKSLNKILNKEPQIKILNENKEVVKAGCVVVSDKDKVLLVSNKEGKIWSFPKGHAEKEETLEQTAQRETEEETGYEVEIIKRLSDLVYTSQQTNELIRVAMFLAKPIKKTDEEESNTQFAWFSVKEAEDILHHNLVFLLKELE